MDREALGRLLWEILESVFPLGRAWSDHPESWREMLCKVAERFLADAKSGRTFHARVSLMGRRDLGLCRVTEAVLCGATMLRCEKDGEVTWANPAVLYAATEVPDDVAAAEIAALAAKREAEALQRATRLAERATVTIEVIVDEKEHSLYVKTSEPLALHHHDEELTTALAPAGVEKWHLSELFLRGHSCGVAIDHCPPDRAQAVADAVLSLGFLGPAVVRPIAPDEDYNELPF